MLDALVVVVVEVAASIAIIGVMLPAPSSIPLLAVTIPIESTFVTSSYVNVPPTDTLPVNVADDPLTDPTEIFGVPLNPAAVPETLPVTLPVKAPTNVVAVTIPVTDAAAPTILVNSTDGEPVRPAEVPEVF